jgi:hypothetical protein
MHGGISVMCAKELNADNIVPDWDTLIVHPDVEDSYSRQIWHPGDIVAVWYSLGRHDKEPSDHAQEIFPDFIWVWTPGGKVPITIKHCTWDGK